MNKLILLGLLCLVLSPVITFGQYEINWEKNYGGSEGDWANDMIKSPEGGFIVCGGTNSNNFDISGLHGINDAWVIKLNENGAIEWQKNYGGSKWEVATSIQATVDEGYIIAGSSDSQDNDVSNNYGQDDFWVFKIDQLGNLVWERNYGGSGVDLPEIIIQTADQGFMVVGGTNSFNQDVSSNFGENDIWILKIDASGAIQWEKSYGGSKMENAFKVIAIDNGYMVVGASNSSDGQVIANHGAYDFWVLKLDLQGNLIWNKNFGGSGSDFAHDIIEIGNDEFFILGTSNSNDLDVTFNNGDDDFWLIKINSNGELLWEKNYGGSDQDRPASIIKNETGGYFLLGETYSMDGDVSIMKGWSDYWVFEIDSDGQIIWERTYGGNSLDAPTKLIQYSNDILVAAGLTTSETFDVSQNYGPADIWVVNLKNISSSIEDNDVNFVSIFPNPTSDHLYFEFGKSTSIDKVNIFQINGAFVHSYVPDQ